MRKDTRNRILIVLGILAVSLFFTFPLNERINLGLDLKGGMHLLLKVDTEKLEENAKRDAVPRAIEILRNRIDSMGVGETVIQRQGETEILVQLPGVTDRDTALSMIGRVAQLEFKLVNDNPDDLKKALEGETVAGYELKYAKKDSSEPVLVEEKASLTGDKIADARVDINSQALGQPQIAFSLNSEGAKQFGLLTKMNVNKRLAIVLDGEVLSAPNINEPIMGGQGVISGRFSFDEASLLAMQLRSGALPAPTHVEEERIVGPLLGKDSIDSGINATILGGILVFIFMIIYYFSAGFISDIALAFNFILIFGIMGLFNALMPESQTTLTLPGIAGIILTLGMAVDANVLINERIREEINNGKPLNSAVQNGYHRAFSAIFDSNLTTIIAAILLFQFGSGPIKGFAVTLIIGLISSLFTALFVTRTIFNLLIDLKLFKKLPMANIFQASKIDFIAKRYVFYVISFLLIIGSVFIFIKKGESAYGIDFAGGQIQEYRFEKPVNADEIRSVLRKINLSDATIQQFEQDPENVMIRTPGETYDEVSSALSENFSDNKYELLRIEKVGPIVGKALRKRALMAILFALGGILIYVGFRFKHFDFATAGVIALLHDVIISAGVLLMLNRQIDLLVITALLTIAGYSINDTIVIYDRVRENTLKMGKSSLRDIINTSLNQTLGRTILTSFTTILVILSLFFKGGEVLNTFSLCLLIGFVTGCYSTIFIAPPLVLLWEKKKK